MSVPTPTRLQAARQFLNVLEILKDATEILIHDLNAWIDDADPNAEQPWESLAEWDGSLSLLPAPRNRYTEATELNDRDLSIEWPHNNRSEAAEGE